MSHSNDMDIKNVNKLIRERQSLYTSQMQIGSRIPDKDIWSILENGNYAPSHKRTEPWRYIVFSNKSLVELFNTKIKIYKKITPKDDLKEKKIAKFKLKGQSLSHVIAVCMKRDEAECIPIQEEEYAVACSVQNILLSMKPLNIIGYWGTGMIAFTEEMKTYLGLGEKDKCMGFIQLGVAKKGLPNIEKQQISPIQDKVEWR